MPNWFERIQKLGPDISICIERSELLDTRKNDDLLKLLSVIDAVQRRYDGLEDLFETLRAITESTESVESVEGAED